MSRTKPLHFGGFLILLTYCIFLNQTLVAQVNGCTEANFSVDADLYSGINSYGMNHPMPATNTHDWFQGASGIGIADESDLPAGPVSDNIAFFSTTMNMMAGTSDGNGNIWQAMIVGRDHNGIGGNKDLTSFNGGGSEKNGDNPQSWECSEGNVGNANDIIDYGAHLRVDNSGDLFFFGFLSTASANGTRHVDFEFYKEDITDVPADACLGYTGPNGGHSAWTFDGADILTTGDVIISFNYTNGGIFLEPSVFIWISEADYNAAGMGGMVGPFTIMGTFYDGDMSDNFGYVEVAADPTNVCTVANLGTVDAPPYGTISSPGSTASSTYPAFHLAELGINLSGFGFDFSAQDPCDLLFGSVYVKTRTSASFQSELKDGAGPASFGTDLEVVILTEVYDTLDCITSEVEICAFATPMSVEYEWSGPNGFTSTDQCPVVMEPGIYDVTATLPNGCANAAPASVEVIFNNDETPPMVMCPEGLTTCTIQDVPPLANTYDAFVGQGGSAADKNVGGFPPIGLDVASFTSSEIMDVNSCPMTLTRTYKISDLCGNEGECTQVILIWPDEELEVRCPAGEVVECADEISVDANDVEVLNLCVPDYDVTVTGPEIDGDADCPETTYTYTYAVEDECGRTAECTQTFTIENDPPQINCPPNTNVECYEDIAALVQGHLDDFNALAGTDDVTVSCDLGFNVTAVTDEFDDNCPNTEYDVVYTVTDDCLRTATCTQTFTIENDPPEINCPPNTNVECYDDIAALVQGHLDDFNNAAGSDDVTVSCDLTYVVTQVTDPFDDNCPDTEYDVVYTVEDECGRTSECTQTFTIQNDPPTIVCAPDEELACGEVPSPSEDDVTVTTSCGIVPIITISEPVIEEFGCNSATYTYTYTVDDGCGRTAECERTYTIVCMCLNCTLTQGFYGNEGGLHCGEITTPDLLDQLLGLGPLTIGRSDLNRSFTILQDEGDCVIEILPGGGPSKQLQNGNGGFNADCVPSNIQYSNSQGTIKNTLAAQTITLTLNLRLDESLGSLMIAEQCFSTYESTSCDPDIAEPVPGTDPDTFCLAASVYDLLSIGGTIDFSVTDLLQLANNALGGMDVGVPLADITKSLDAINKGFDKCRIISEFFAPDVAPMIQQAFVINNPTDVGDQLSIYPNPTNDKVFINHSLKIDEPASLWVLDLNGKTISHIDFVKDKFNQKIELEVSGYPQGTYMVRLSSKETVLWAKFIKQ